MKRTGSGKLSASMRSMSPTAMLQRQRSRGSADSAMRTAADNASRGASRRQRESGEGGSRSGSASASPCSGPGSASNSEHGSPPQLSCPPPLSLPALSLPGQRPQDASDDPAASTEVASSRTSDENAEGQSESVHSGTELLGN